MRKPPTPFVTLHADNPFALALLKVYYELLVATRATDQERARIGELIGKFQDYRAFTTSGKRENT